MKIKFTLPYKAEPEWLVIFESNSDNLSVCYYMYKSESLIVIVILIVGEWQFSLMSIDNRYAVTWFVAHN